MAQVHVTTGVERRRRWSPEQKRAVVAAFAPGAVVLQVSSARMGEIFGERVPCAAMRPIKDMFYHRAAAT